MDSDEAGMQELGNDASFISLLCDAGCSERPIVSAILEVSMPLSLIFFFFVLNCVCGHQMSNFNKHIDSVILQDSLACIENTVKTHVIVYHNL